MLYHTDLLVLVWHDGADVRVFLYHHARVRAHGLTRVPYCGSGRADPKTYRSPFP